MTKKAKMRFHLLDALRGLAIINMVLYHLCFDLVFIGDVNISWLHKEIGYFWQQAICWTFIFLAGMCWNFDRQPLKRGIVIFLWGLAITFVTHFFLPAYTIFWGILSLLGFAILFMIPLSKRWCKIPPLAGFSCFFTAFLLFKFCLGNSFPSAWWPQWASSSPAVVQSLLTCLGFKEPGFFSLDYFPIFPWFCLFAAGYWFWRLIEGDGRVLYILGKGYPLLEWPGRHALTIYLLHQPILVAFLAVLMMLF